MDNIFRIGNRLRCADDFVKNCGCNVSHLIANEFWIKTTNLTKRIAVTLKNAAGALVANTPVKYAVFEFSEAIPFNADFMALTSKGVYTTDASGNFEVIYTGSAQIGGYAYLAILHPHSSPTESVIWKVTIS
jgi:hypothetical protein